MYYIYTLKYDIDFAMFLKLSYHTKVYLCRISSLGYCSGSMVIHLKVEKNSK